MEIGEIDSLWLGLDVGTTAVKAAVFDAGFELVSHGRAPTPWRGSELDPDELLAAAIAAAERALDGRRVAGVGVASMAETGVLTDDALRPVVPSIAWWDERGADEAAELADALPDFSERTGQPPSAMCTLAKYAWMRRNWPDAARGTRWFNVAEWIVLGLGGEPRPEASLASRTGFYDLHTGRAWAPAMAWVDAPETLAPPHVPAGTPLGNVGGVGRAERRARWRRVERRRAAGGARRRGEARRRRRRAARGRRARPCGRRGGRGRGGRGRRARLVRDGGGDPARDGAAGPRDRANARSPTGSRSVATPSPGRYVLQGATWSGEKLQAVIDGYGDDSAEYEAALEEVGAAGADILARMERAGRPVQAARDHRRLVGPAGGPRDEGRHLGAFEHVAEGYAGCRGAARAASRGS